MCFPLKTNTMDTFFKKCLALPLVALYAYAWVCHRFHSFAEESPPSFGGKWPLRCLFRLALKK